MTIVIGIIMVLIFLGAIGKVSTKLNEQGANREAKKYYKALNKQMEEEKRAKENNK